MGQKTHPIGFRLGISKDWQSRWFASRPEEYRELVRQDAEVRDVIMSRYPDAGISRVEIERGNDVVITHSHGTSWHSNRARRATSRGTS